MQQRSKIFLDSFILLGLDYWFSIEESVAIT